LFKKHHGEGGAKGEEVVVEFYYILPLSPFHHQKSAFLGRVNWGGEMEVKDGV